MSKLIASVQIFSARVSQVSDAARAEEAVQEYLDTLPDTAADDYRAFVDGSDASAADRGEAIYDRANSTAYTAGTQGWHNPGGADISLEIYIK